MKTRAITDKIDFVRASSYLPAIETKVTDPVSKFLSRDYKIGKPVSPFVVANIPADISYCLSHGAVGTKLNILSK